MTVKTGNFPVSDATMQGVDQAVQVFERIHSSTKEHEHLTSGNALRIVNQLAGGFLAEIQAVKKTNYPEKIAPKKVDLMNKLKGWLIELDYYLGQLPPDDATKGARKLLEQSLRGELDLVASQHRADLTP